MNTLLLLCSGVGGAVWGSFLNVVAFRGLRDVSLTTRSTCPTCQHVLLWYDLIPLVSWFLLNGQCRLCHAPISWWYPLIELITALWSMVLVALFPVSLLPMLMIFSSALIVTIRTDGESFLILRWCTLGIIPIGIIGSALGYNVVSLGASIVGMLIGFAVLGGTAFIFRRIRGYDGLGAGDIELLGAIGSFLGPFGVWITLLIASLSGSLYGLIVLILQSKRSLQTALPFGLFLALGAAATLVIMAHNVL